MDVQTAQLPVQHAQSDGKQKVETSVESRVYKVLDELRQGGFFCDAVIRCGDQAFKVQRNILSTCSPYFKALFTYDNAAESTKTTKTMNEFDIQEISADVMELLIKYAYTRDVPLDPGTIAQLLPAADRFQMEGLVKACCNALIQEMTLESCMHIRSFARAFPFSCSRIKEAADKFLLENFAWIYCFSADFLQVDVDDLSDILKSDRLNARTEGIPLDAVCRWVAYDFENRRQYTERLLKHVRMGLLTNEAIFGILNYHKMTTSSAAVHSVLLEASKLADQPEIRGSLQQNTPRLPNDLVFVLGGSNLGWPLQIVETFDIRSMTWKECPALEFGLRSYHGTAVIEQTIYVVGGFDGTDYLNHCSAFHPAEGKWTQVAPMHDKRCYVSVTALDGYIYALGGFDGRIRQRSVERFHPPSNQWTLMQPMLCPRSDGGATAVRGTTRSEKVKRTHHTDISDRVTLCSVITDDKFSPFASRQHVSGDSTKCCHYSIVTLTGKIYIMGGFNGQESLSSTECYDPSTNQWTLVKPMRDRRSGVGVVAHCGLIYAAGGFNGTRRLRSLVRYNPDTDEWTTLHSMLNARSNFAMTVSFGQTD